MVEFGVIVSWVTMRVSCRKEFLDFGQHFDELIDFFGGVIEIKAGAGGGFDSELAHEWLIAMMTTP